ncbi:hypothetical protein MMC07_008121 [Pseudocyphellaria aurata]|nr:hypothetical protein [Pseudocyphellaria aurata]
MQTTYILSLICGLWTVASVLAKPYGVHPGLCATDNCLCAFQTTQPASRLSEASQYCSQYLSTSINAVVVNALVKSTKTVTLADKTITAHAVTATKTTTTGFTTTITTGKDKLKARSDAFPTFAEHCKSTGTTDKAALVTSACSCLLVNTPPVTTKTVINTVLATAPTTIPVTTVTPTTTTTLTVTSTVWIYVPPPSPCPNPLTC